MTPEQISKLITLLPVYTSDEGDDYYVTREPDGDNGFSTTYYVWNGEIWDLISEDQVPEDVIVQCDPYR